MQLHLYLLIVLVKMKKKNENENERDLEKLSKKYPTADFHIDYIGRFEE